jgi:hypothetical protein
MVEQQTIGALADITAISWTGGKESLVSVNSRLARDVTNSLRNNVLSCRQGL